MLSLSNFYQVKKLLHCTSIYLLSSVKCKLFIRYRTQFEPGYCRTEFLCVDDICVLARSKIFAILQFLRSWFSLSYI